MPLSPKGGKGLKIMDFHENQKKHPPGHQKLIFPLFGGKLRFPAPPPETIEIPMDFYFNEISFENKLDFKSNYTKQEYFNIIEKAKKYIEQGDILQVVTSQRFETKYDLHSWILQGYSKGLSFYEFKKPQKNSDFCERPVPARLPYCCRRLLQRHSRVRRRGGGKVPAPHSYIGDQS